MDKIIIKKCNGYYTIYNNSFKASEENHSHTKTLKGAKILKHCIENKIIPKSTRLIESAFRVTIDTEYQERLANDL